MARGGARPGAGRPARKSANTSPVSARARPRARGGRKSKTVAGRQGRAVGDRSADPIREKCPHTLRRAGRGDRGEHQGVGLDDAGAGWRGRRSDCGPRQGARRPAARHRQDPGNGRRGLDRGAEAGLCPGQRKFPGAVETTGDKRGAPAPLPPVTAAGPEPKSPRLRQHDVTIEKVAALLGTAAPKGLLIWRDELTGWIDGMTSYNDAGRAFWVEAYGGRPYRLERQKHPEPIEIAYFVVAVYGSTQPDKIAALMRGADDGLLSRFLWLWPEPIPFRLGRALPGADRTPG